MNDLETYKKKIIYKASHRGSKEMDIFLGNFVKKHIADLDYNDLKRRVPSNVIPAYDGLRLNL